jgi:hypothetical protein
MLKQNLPQDLTKLWVCGSPKFNLQFENYLKVLESQLSYIKGKVEIL